MQQYLKKRLFFYNLTMHIHVLKQYPLDIVRAEYIIILFRRFKQWIVKAWGEKAQINLYK